MFTDNCNPLPAKIWMSEQEFYSDAELGRQIGNLARHPFCFHHVALTPDGHVGYGMPIGGVAAFDGALCPNAVGVDIACGMLAYPTGILKKDTDREMLARVVRAVKKMVPMGKNHRSDATYQKQAEILIEGYRDFCSDADVEKNADLEEVSVVYSQLGTLGGGNHFCEIQEDEDGQVWVMIHSGSRNLGKKVCDKFSAIAEENCKKWKTPVPCADLSVLPIGTDEAQRYLADMEFCIRFSFQNRICILENVMVALSAETGCSEAIRQEGIVNIHHNYASIENHYGKNMWVHRKGATRVTPKITGIIPGSMGTMSYIVKGSADNTDSFHSCSHGAGRPMSRKQAKETIRLDQYRKSMEGIVSEDIDEEHIDESPMAYKDIDQVMENQKDLVEIIHILAPLASMKG